VFITEETSLPLEAYADQYVEIAGRIAGSALKREAFRTKDGAAGFWWRFEQTLALPGQRLRQTQYVFENGQRKCLITCTVAADGGETFDGVFDECMKTFKFDR
jgi:hypothetical protein